MAILRLKSCRTTATVAVTIALLVVALLIAPHSCQSGSTNFLQLFLEASNGSLLANGSTAPEISDRCTSDLKLIDSAIQEHSNWATKCE